MVKISKIFLVVLLGVVLSGCVSWSVPKDFSFVYQWVGKMVPAPEHNEYIISVSADGQGKILYYADYNIWLVDESKLWKREFTVSPEQMKQVYQDMKAEKAFAKENTVEPKISAKENYSIMTVNADNNIYYAKTGDTTGVNSVELEKTIKNLVPDQIWAELEAQVDSDLSRNNDVLDYVLPEIE